MVVWLPLDGLAFSIGLDRRYGLLADGLAKACPYLAGPLSFVGPDGWAAYRLRGGPRQIPPRSFSDVGRGALTLKCPATGLG